MNTVTNKTLDALTASAKAASSGGGVITSGYFRSLTEIPGLSTSFSGIADFFDKSDIVTQFSKAAAADNTTEHDIMTCLAENEFVSSIHRDTVVRYGDRISLIIAETCVRANQANTQLGVINQMRGRLNYLETLRGKTDA